MFENTIYYKPIQVKGAFYENYAYFESNCDNTSSLHEYFEKIKPYLADLINFYKAKDEWKVQLSMQIKFVSFINNSEIDIIHSKSDNVEIMSGYDTNNIIDMLIDTFINRYQEGLETKMKRSSYVFNHIDLLGYHFNKITLNRSSSYIPTLP